MRIEKSYLFGAFNKSQWDTESLLKYKLLAPGSDELKKHFMEEANGALLSALRCEGLKPGLPDLVKVEEIVEADTFVDKRCVVDGQVVMGEWTKKAYLGRVDPKKLPPERRLQWSYKEGGCLEGQGNNLKIDHRSFKRVALTFTGKGDREFYTFIVEHYAHSPKSQVLVGQLMFVVVPELQLFK